MNFVNTTTAIGRHPHKKFIHKGQIDTHDAHHIFTQSNLSVSSAIVKPLISSMSKRAGVSFSASASAKQKPTHCTAMIARKVNDKNADMGYHAVPPPCYKAGGDSKREELCQQGPKQFTRTATGEASSSRRPEATRDRFNSGWMRKFVLGRTLMESNTSENSMIHRTTFSLSTRRNGNSARWCCTAFV